MSKQKVLWAAAHEITEEQRAELEKNYEIVLLKEINLNLWNLITNLKLDAQRRELANELVEETLRHGVVLVQPGGDPAFQFQLGCVADAHIYVWYAFSERVSVDVPQPDGSVVKTSVFKHMGWV